MKWMMMLCAVGLLGCPREGPAEVMLLQKTWAPPTLTATVVDNHEVQEIRLSPGVAMAVGCWDTCDNWELSCENATVTSADETIVAAHDVYRRGHDPTFVLSASSPGVTTVTVRTACGTQSYRTIVD
jgi:hypothetical protein